MAFSASCPFFRFHHDSVTCEPFQSPSAIVTHTLARKRHRFALPVSLTPYCAVAPCSANCRFCSERLKRKDEHGYHCNLRPGPLWLAGLQRVLQELRGLPVRFSISGLEATVDLQFFCELLSILVAHRQAEERANVPPCPGCEHIHTTGRKVGVGEKECGNESDGGRYPQEWQETVLYTNGSGFLHVVDELLRDGSITGTPWTSVSSPSSPSSSWSSNSGSCSCCANATGADPSSSSLSPACSQSSASSSSTSSPSNSPSSSTIRSLPSIIPSYPLITSHSIPYGGSTPLTYSAHLVTDLMRRMRFARVELSRHHPDARANNRIVRFASSERIADNESLRSVVWYLQHVVRCPVRLVCVLQRTGVSCWHDVREYLRWAREWLGVRDVVFRELCTLRHARGDACASGGEDKSADEKRQKDGGSDEGEVCGTRDDEEGEEREGEGTEGRREEGRGGDEKEAEEDEEGREHDKPGSEEEEEELYDHNSVFQYVEGHRVQCAHILDEAFRTHPHELVAHRCIAGYYFSSLQCTWQGNVSVAFESSDYTRLQHTHTHSVPAGTHMDAQAHSDTDTHTDAIGADVQAKQHHSEREGEEEQKEAIPTGAQPDAIIRKLVYFPNGNLCSDWNSDRDVLMHVLAHAHSW